MWKFLLWIIACPSLVILSAQGEKVYLTTVDRWKFYKVRASGAMTNANVKSTCEAARMRYPCYWSGTGSCTSTYWGSGCIRFDDGGVHCRTLSVLSHVLCGSAAGFGSCQPLDATFVYLPNWHSDGSAPGMDADTGTSGLFGAHYYNKWALCVGLPLTSAAAPPDGMYCTEESVASFSCKAV
ncbi:Hypp1664 [Branchiostoma lanceolatum]|uniref:Hypp1664 protein n=1 Tax=Branchiostoma lanceolatum TaxID=7740 RepID=A0A8J9ZJN4_BRALA|nr:Hypp1664 [Branchiostoma lanceolatum]